MLCSTIYYYEQSVQRRNLVSGALVQEHPALHIAMCKACSPSEVDVWSISLLGAELKVYFTYIFHSRELHSSWLSVPRLCLDASYLTSVTFTQKCSKHHTEIWGLA